MSRLVVCASETRRIGEPCLIHLSRTLVELLSERAFISRRNLQTPTRFNGGENNVRRLILLFPTVADHLHQMLSLVFTVLRRAHLLSVQPLPELQPDCSRWALGDEAGSGAPLQQGLGCREAADFPSALHERLELSHCPIGAAVRRLRSAAGGTPLVLAAHHAGYRWCSGSSGIRLSLHHGGRH